MKKKVNILDFIVSMEVEEVFKVKKQKHQNQGPYELFGWKFKNLRIPKKTKKTKPFGISSYISNSQKIFKMLFVLIGKRKRKKG